MDPLLDRLARDIARQMGRDTPPPLDPSQLMGLDDQGQLVMVMLDNLLEHLDGGLPPTDNLIWAYVFLLALQLQEIRYQMDRHYEWTRQAVADFQARLVEQARAGRLPGLLLQQLIMVLHDVRIKPEPTLREAIEAMEVGKGLGEPPPPEQLLEILEEQLGKDNEFQAAQLFNELTVGGPGEGRAMLAGVMLRGDYERLREAVPLLVLDTDPEMRRTLLEGLSEASAIKCLSPTGLRRLIALRNWLPEQERKLLDKVVRTARRRGLECQPWPEESQADIRASPVDGSGAQGFLIVSRAGRRFLFSSLLLRLSVGVMDAWTEPRPTTKKHINKTLAMARREINSEPVSRAYLDRIVQHHLAVGAQRGELPPVGLLALAEALGATGWQPNPLDPRQTVETLLKAAADNLPPKPVIERLLKESDLWSIETGLVDSWFEDDQAVAQLLAKSRARRLETLARQVLERIVEPRREHWAEKMLWLALWIREVAGPNDTLAIDFLLVAQALYQGVPIKGIGLMIAIAERTVETQDVY